jgi:hypothetical protein
MTPDKPHNSQRQERHALKALTDENSSHKTVGGLRLRLRDHAAQPEYGRRLRRARFGTSAAIELRTSSMGLGAVRYTCA